MNSGSKIRAVARRDAISASYEGKTEQPMRWDALVGLTIVAERHGHPFFPMKGSYGAHTFITQCGREFIVRHCLNELTLAEVIPLSNSPHTSHIPVR